LVDLKNRFEMEIEAVNELQGIMIKPQYQVFKPACTGTFEKQWKSCFDDFQSSLTNHPNQKAFIVRVFVDAENSQQFLQYSEQIKQTFSKTNIPFSILAESPEKPNLVIIEAGFVNAENIKVEYGHANLLRFCKLSTSGYSEFWFAGITGDLKENTLYDSAKSAFRQLLTTFMELELGFNQIVRQWNYVEQIFGIEQIDHQKRQNYQLFNEARGEYYSRYRTAPDFPSATGIGVDFNGVTIECMAVAGDAKLKIVAINNPQQLNSYKYGQNVLKGEPLKNRTSNQPPQFERAKLMTNGLFSKVFISGTASIVGQETIGLNDVEEQTRVTIENIELLTSESNLKLHCPELAVIPDKYVYVRVYVKNEEDIPSVKAICRQHFGEIPMTIVKADICRAELLVEIEAEKVS